jgi:hypothetical protein
MGAYANQEVRLIDAVLAAQVAERLWIASGVIDPRWGSPIGKAWSLPRTRWRDITG